jgi:hypothetical protein
MGAASVGRFVPVLYQHDIILGVMGTPVGEKKNRRCRAAIFYSPSQIIGHFGFYRCIIFAMHLGIMYAYSTEKSICLE